MTIRWTFILLGLSCAITFVSAQSLAPGRATSVPTSGQASSQPQLRGEKLSSDEEKFIRDSLAKIQKAVEKNDDATILALMTPAEAKLAKPLMTAERQYQNKVATLLQIALSKGISMPAETVTGIWTFNSMKDLNTTIPCKKINKNRIVCLRDVKPSLVFKKVSDRWTFTLDMEASAIKFQIKVAQESEKAIEEVIEGINKGGITKDNWRDNMDGIMSRRITPLMDNRINEIVTE